LLHDGRRHAEAWNFGPTDDAGERPVRWVVERFIDEWGSGTWVTPADATTKHFHEALRLSLDSSKARERLGWAPVWAPEVAVRRTAAWYHEYYRAPARARELVADQLRTYQADARAAGLSWATANGEATS
jgi:CDP-glucose 4,6-dehydratase